MGLPKKCLSQQICDSLSLDLKEDLFLLSHNEMICLFDNFTIKEYTSEVIKHPNKYFYKDNLISKLPRMIITRMQFISPTNIFILRK